MSNEESQSASNGNAARQLAVVDPNTGTEHRDFSVFTVAEKRAIISVGSLAALFSPLSSSIYFPALDTVTKALGVSATRVNLKVTTYLVGGSVSPAKNEPQLTIALMESDISGNSPHADCRLLGHCWQTPGVHHLLHDLSRRQPGVGLQDSYAALLVLRCVQSAGSSGTVALANGLVGDMITSVERGSYIAFASLGSMLGPSLSPIIVGLISQYLGWHWLFWFLLILSGIFFVLLLLLLPKTCRQVFSDGSIPPPPPNASVSVCIRHCRRKKRGEVAVQEQIVQARRNCTFRFPSPLPTLKVVTDLETGAIFLVTGLRYVGFYGIMTGATASFNTVYQLNNTETAQMYLLVGVGGVVSAFTTGRLVDFNYLRHAKRAGMPVVRSKAQDLSNFSIEKTRLEIALLAYYLSAVFMIVYG